MSGRAQWLPLEVPICIIIGMLLHVVKLERTLYSTILNSIELISGSVLEYSDHQL